MTKNSVVIVERELTKRELELETIGFTQYAKEHGNPAVGSLRYTFIAMDGEKFVGCASGLTNENSGQWFYLSDMYVEKPYRGQGIGAALLRKLEERVAVVGVQNIWTWTAGYEAPGFYKKQGYQVFLEMEGWLLSGHAHVGLVKSLTGAEPIQYGGRTRHGPAVAIRLPAGLAKARSTSKRSD